jgi:hypothetical protein
MSNFAHVEDFIQFSTIGFVCLLACTILDISNTDGVPKKGVPLEKLATRIVNDVWHEPGDNEEITVLQAPEVQDIEHTDTLTFANICKCREGNFNNKLN